LIVTDSPSVLWAQKGRKVKLDHRVTQDRRVLTVRPVPLGLTVTQGHRDQQGRLEQPDPKERKVTPAHKVLRAIKEILEIRGLKVHRAVLRMSIPRQRWMPFLKSCAF
jgi:hypothetical protein